MKCIFLAGSRRFSGEIRALARSLEKSGVEVRMTDVSGEQTGGDSLGGEREALLDAFRKIDISDSVYVYAKGGYVGHAVAMEVAYAYAHAKRVIASEVVEELSVQAVISETINPGELLGRCV